MPKIRCWCAVLALFGATALRAEIPAQWTGAVTSARSDMAELEAQGFAGSVLVACGTDILFEADYGVAEGETRIPSYWIASITKQFTAAAVLRLVEQGRLSLDDPMSRFFPDVPADKAGITVFQLLTHMSGLPNDYAADDHAHVEDAARAVFAVPLQSPPGEAFRYTNDGYALLAMIVERASGEPFEWYMVREILRPAGMTQFGFTTEPVEPQSVLPPLSGPAEMPATRGFRGPTGMRASARDLWRWTQAMDAGTVIGRDSVRLMTETHWTLDDGSGVGFNWFAFEDGSRRWLNTRGYEDAGYNGVVQVEADTGLAIVTLTHAGPLEDEGGRPTPWSRSSRTALVEAFTGAGAPECDAGPWPGG